MKVLGWVFVVIGIGNLVLALIGLSIGEPQAATNLRAVFLFGVLGAFMISRGKKKEQEEKEKKDWNKTN
ncbi:MAG: hypothetical protein IKW77_01750 [Salinivirgaceae bacterium]|nr:hypothetical protein [Salinivirgaceae bacterium]